MWRDNGWERGRGRGHPALKLSQHGHLGVSVATVPRAEFPPHPARFRARWGGAAGRAVLTWAGSAHLGGAGLRCCRSCPDWAGRAQPGLIRARSCSPAWADGAGLPPPSSPPWTQSRGLLAASPGVWGSWRGLDSPLPGHGGAQGGAGGSLEPGERDRDRSLLSPALSWRVSLGKQNDPPRIPSFPRLQVKKKNRETEARFGPGWYRKGKCSPKWGSCFSQWLVSGDEPLPSLQTVVPGQERAWSFHLPLVLHWSHSSAGWNWDRRVWNWSGSPRPAAPQPRVFPPPFPHVEPHGTRGGDFGSPLVLDFSRLRALAVSRVRVHPQSPWGRKRTRNVPPAAASWGAERLRVQMGKGFGP